MIDIKPNVRKTLESMKSSGYSFTQAIADIVDNSIDANATRIDIVVDIKNEMIQIIDNGIGMEFDRIVEALRLGSETGKSSEELGKYGFGLKSASFSQSNVITVVSKVTEINEVTFDINKSMDDNDWIAYRSDNYCDLIKTQTGTAIIWNDLYRLGASTEDRYDRLVLETIELKKFICKTFYQFIDSGIEFYLNGVLLQSESPFYEKSPALKHLNSDDIIFGEEKITLKAYDISAVSKRGNDSSLLQDQGISVFRNNRFISNIGWISRMKHPSLNMIRVRMDVGSKEDYLLNIDFKKSNVELPMQLKQDIRDFEKTAINAFGKSNKVRATKKRNRLDGKDIDIMQTKSKVNPKNIINQVYIEKMGVSIKEMNDFLDRLSKLNKIKNSNKLSSSEEQFLYELLDDLVENESITYEELLFTEPYNKFAAIIENYWSEND